MEILRDIEKRLPIGSEHDLDLFDLADIPTGQLSPPFADIIPMDTEFSPIPLLNGFVRNILHRQISLTVEAWRCIIQFCKTNAFTDDSSRVGLQLLFVCSKADPVELEELFFPYSTMFETYVSPFLATFHVERMSDGEMVKMKQFLLSPIVLNTFKECLDQVMEASWDLSTISTLIISMDMFMGNVQLPLRGATVHNGIFVNFLRLCKANMELNEADLFTLAGHETIHFLARKLSNDFNFSSPFTGRSIENPRKEPGTEKKLELGRMFEISLFGSQPNWFVCTRDAAARFLLLVREESSTIPLKIGHGLVPRKKPSPSFAIDLTEEQAFMGLC